MPLKKADPQKRGAKGHYAGSRLHFLESYCDKYNLLRHKCHLQFWHKFYEAWWKKYPWRLPNHKEPPDDPKKMQELSFVGGDEGKKTEVEGRTRERISAWFSYRVTLQNSPRGGGAWAPILKQVHQQFNPKPHCRSVTQQFMHEEKLHVNAAFVSKYGEGRGTGHIPGFF